MPVVPFVDRDDANVAILLRDAGLFDVAHAAEDLQRGRAELDGVLGAPALDDRDHQLDERLVLLAHLLVGMALREVERRRGDVGQRAHRLDRAPSCVISMRRTSGCLMIGSGARERAA